jgi:hypothetical protein
MRNLLKVLLILFFVIWFKNADTIVFCDKYDKGTNITFAYQNEAIIAVIDNSLIAGIEMRGIK